jgi:hypothetical protein
MKIQVPMVSQQLCVGHYLCQGVGSLGIVGIVEMCIQLLVQCWAAVFVMAACAWCSNGCTLHLGLTHVSAAAER